MIMYLAGRWEKREYIAGIRQHIRANFPQHTVTSRWLDEEDGKPAIQAALDDYEDIDAANMLVLYLDAEPLPPGIVAGGRFIEFGYAVAKHKALCTIGPVGRTIFLKLDNVLRAPSLEDFYDFLSTVV